MEDYKQLHATPDWLRGFKRAYNTAVKQGKDTFLYEGNEFYVGYAQYLIIYLEGKFNNL